MHRAVWRSVHVEPSSVALVHALRDAGSPSTWAPTRRPAARRTCAPSWGTTTSSTSSFYSCDLGAAKPDAVFFAAVLDRLDSAAPEVLFVDDQERNVVAARECGLAAEHWQIDDGIASLRGRLAGHGLAFS